jgi:methyl-accepting chemotaxis protein
LTEKAASRPKKNGNVFVALDIVEHIQQIAVHANMSNPRGNTMTIAKKIAILVLLGVMALVLQGSFALWQLAKINDGVFETEQNLLPSIMTLDKAQIAFLRARPPLLSHLLESDPAKKAALEKRFNERIDQMRQQLGTYGKLVIYAKDKELYETDLKQADQYEASARKVLAASRDGQRDEANRLLGEMRPTIDGFAKALSDHASYNEELASKHAKETAADYQSSRSIVIVLILGSACALGIIGFLILRQIRQSLDAMVGLFGKVQKELDFTLRLEVSGKDEVAQAGRAFNELLNGLQTNLRQLSSHAENVHQAASRVSNASHEMSIASGQQSESSAAMAAAIEELTVSVSHVADRAGETRKLSAEAGRLANEGEGVIDETVNVINSIATTVGDATSQIVSLEHQSEKISNVVSVIKEIADQTNLLALNAAIEAARAGEQGRGFAVVADEVRKLAERTGKSTQEITGTIQDMQSGALAAVNSIKSVESTVKEGVEQASQASTAMQKIGDGSHQTLEMVGDITESMREQSTASTAIAQQVERIAQMTEQNSAAADETSENAQQLAMLAQQMQGIVAAYRV